MDSVRRVILVIPKLTDKSSMKDLRDTINHILDNPQANCEVLRRYDEDANDYVLPGLYIFCGDGVDLLSNTSKNFPNGTDSDTIVLEVTDLSKNSNLGIVPIIRQLASTYESSYVRFKHKTEWSEWSIYSTPVISAKSPISCKYSLDKLEFYHDTSGVLKDYYTKVKVDEYGHVVSGSNPTTLKGYGIEDAFIDKNGCITLGNQSITPLTLANKGVTTDSKQSLINKTYNGYTLGSACDKSITHDDLWKLSDAHEDAEMIPSKYSVKKSMMRELSSGKFSGPISLRVDLDTPVMIIITLSAKIPLGIPVSGSIIIDDSMSSVSSYYVTGYDENDESVKVIGLCNIRKSDDTHISQLELVPKNYSEISYSIKYCRYLEEE